MRQPGNVVLWCALVLAGIVTLGVVAVAMRRWMMRDESTTTGPAFTLQDLREMRDRGDITSQEFDTMRAGILGSYGAAEKLEVLEEADDGSTA